MSENGVCKQHSGLEAKIDGLESKLDKMHGENREDLKSIYGALQNLNINGAVTKTRLGLWGTIFGILGGGVVSLIFFLLRSFLVGG